MSIDTRNLYGVQRTALGPALEHPPKRSVPLTPDEALNLASWLLIASGKCGAAFERTLGAICDGLQGSEPVTTIIKS